MLRRLCLALLVPLLAVACDDNSVEPEELAEASAPSLDFVSGPAEAGPHVVRYEDGSVYTWNFPAEVTPDGEPWTIMFGIDDVANMTLCGGAGTAYPISGQDVVRDDHFNRTQLRKQVPAYAGHSADVYAYDWCDRMDVPWIAVGEASAAWSVNMHSSNGASLNTGLLSFNSWLTDLSTGRKYHAHYNQLWEWPPFGLRTVKMFIK